jgi:lipopolysaccharide transport system ATP-binding protein
MSSNIAIKVEDLGKLYRLGEVGTGTLSHDLNRWYAKIAGKEDPFAKVGEANDRTSKGEGNYVWALQDINFEVQKGEVLGVIGRNGAGKSTLLKLLSKVTQPTRGSIKVNGRIASLLEVGTGFHPEMTGRENIYLNGAIMGMTKREINAKFDQIVDFAGVERYVDTPVKRYSSGMYVRLAFAVAAHLEPEILIVDEVLAVGDAEFQKKCIGKMKNVSVNEGRTVLFVSHNMDSISHLCNRGIMLANGRLTHAGPIDEVIKGYLATYDNLGSVRSFEDKSLPGNEFAKLLSVKVFTKEEGDGLFFDMADEIFVEVRYIDTNPLNKNTAIIHIKDFKGNTLFATNEFNNEAWETYHDESPAVITAVCHIPAELLAEGKYSVLVAIGSYSPNIVHALVDDAVGFTVVDKGLSRTTMRNTTGPWPGLIRPFIDWSISREPYNS